MDGIEAVTGIRSSAPAARVHRAGETRRAKDVPEASEFAEKLDETFGELSDLEKSADRTALGFAAGEVQDVHQVMIAMGRADIAFRMMLEVRDRIVDAYKEISRLQV